MTLDAEPVVVEPEAVETTPVVAAPVETIAPVAETVEQAPVTEPVKAEPPVSKPVVVAGHRHATAPMTRAPAPDYVRKHRVTAHECAAVPPLKVKLPVVLRNPRH